MDTFSLFVSHLPKDATEEELREVFSNCGPVKGVYISCSKPDLAYCYGFVRFHEPKCIQKAMQELGHWVLRGKTLRVEISHTTKNILRQTTAPRYPSWKKATGDSNDRSRVKEACCTLNKELDLVHGDEALDLVDLLVSMEAKSASYAPRVKGNICPGALNTKESVLNSLGAFSSEPAAVVSQRKAVLEQKIASLEADIEKHHAESVQRKDYKCKMTKPQSNMAIHPPDSVSVSVQSENISWLNYGKLHTSCDSLSLDSGICMDMQAKKLESTNQTLQSQVKRQTAMSRNATPAVLGRGRGWAVLDLMKRS